MRRHQGFAYVLLLLGVALIGLVAGSAVSLGASMARRDAEQALLWVGMDYQRALRSHAAAGGAPRSLDDLLRDPRVPGIRRHLRQRHADPLTGKDAWGLVTDASGGIIGVYSLAPGRPLRQQGFEPGMEHLADADRYSQWVFGLPAAQQRGATPAVTTAPSLQFPQATPPHDPATPRPQPPR